VNNVMSSALRVLSSLLPIIVLVSILFPSDAISSNIWSGATVPTVTDAGPDSAVELGVKFRSDSDGYITGIRAWPRLISPTRLPPGGNR
jgi:hypothetical protein